MFYSNARRTFPVLVLILAAFLSFAPSEASAAGFGGRGGRELSARIESRLASVWTYFTNLSRIWGEVGPRMDDNG